MKASENPVNALLERGANFLRDMLLRGGLLNLFLIFCIASFAWPVMHLKRFADLGKNKLKWDERIELAQTTGVLFVVILAILAVWGWRRRQQVRETFFDTIGYLNAWLLWALALPLILVAGVPGIEKKHAFLSLAMIMGAAAVVGVWIYRLIGLRRATTSNFVATKSNEPQSAVVVTETPELANVSPARLGAESEEERSGSVHYGEGADPVGNGSTSNVEHSSTGTLSAAVADPVAIPAEHQQTVGTDEDPGSRDARLLQDTVSEKTSDRSVEPAWGMWAAWAALAAMASAFTYHFSRLAINNHHSFRSQMADLGYYDNIFYQSIHGKPLGCTFLLGEVHYSSHFDPLLVLLSPLYLLYPQAEGILVIQSAWLALGVVPMYLIAKDALKTRWLGVVFAGLLLLYAPLHGPALYDFHSLTLLGPLALWLMYFIQRRSWRAFYCVLILCLLTREDISFVMSLVGVSILISSEGADRKHGLITIGLAVVYFVFVKTSVMISSELLNCTKGGTCFASMFKDLVPAKKGTAEILLSLWTNPSFTLAHIFDPRKVTYFLQLFIPLAFIPLLAPRGRIIMLFGIAVIALGTKFALFSIGFQYSTWIYPFAFAITPLALRTLQSQGIRFLVVDKSRLVPTLIGMMVCASVLLTWRYGAIVKNDAFRGGFGRVTYELNDDHRRESNGCAKR